MSIVLVKPFWLQSDPPWVGKGPPQWGSWGPWGHQFINQINPYNKTIFLIFAGIITQFELVQKTGHQIFVLPDFG